MKVEKFHHVAFRCKDAKETVEFYKKVLDVSIGFRGEGKQELYLQAFLKAAERLKTHWLTDTNPFVGDRKERLKETLQMHSLLIVQPDTVELFMAQDEIYCNDKKRLYINKYDIPHKMGKMLARDAEEEDEEANIENLYNKPQNWFMLAKMIDGDLANPFENSTNQKQKLREELLRDVCFYDERVPKRKAILYTKRKRFVHAMEQVYIKFRCKNPISVLLR